MGLNLNGVGENLLSIIGFGAALWFWGHMLAWGIMTGVARVPIKFNKNVNYTVKGDKDA